MNIREISDIFKDTADNITAIKSYNFGWASDRVRQSNTEDFQELNEFPRVFFAVPTITGSDQTRKQDTYQVTLFFDDLLGYDNEGDEDPTLQIDKWANLQQYANYFVQRLNKIKQSILPNYLFIPEAPSITFDSFTGIQRMITVQLSFNLVVPTNCDPGIITLVQCIANIVTSSNLTASLTTILKFAASLEGRATLTADINFVQKVASSLNANASLVSDINFVQKVQASLLATGTTTADLTVTGGSTFDADAQAFFDRVTTAGGTLTITEQNAVNTLVVQMKADGIWTKMKAIYPMVGGGQANPSEACRQNLKSSSFTGTFTSGWTFANTGVQGNGTSAFFNTLFNPNAQSTQNSSHVSVYLRTNSGGSSQGIFTCASDFGTINNNFGIGKYNGGVQMRGYIGSGFNSGAAFNSNNLGLWTVSTNGSSTQILYEDGTSVANAVYTQLLPNFNVYLGAGNYGTGGAQLYSAFNYAFASIGDGLSATDMTNFYTAVQAFQTTLNRQV